MRNAIDEVVLWRPSKFKSCRKDEERTEEAVYFDEHTTAGLLDSLQGCTRFLITDEADVVLKKMNYVLTPPGSRDVAMNDCRSQFLTLFDRPRKFIRKLKNETIKVTDAKLNILV